MDKQELLEDIKRYIKENLSIEIKRMGGEYCTTPYLKVVLKIENYEISTSCADIP